MVLELALIRQGEQSAKLNRRTCSNRCEGGCGAATDLTVKEHDVDSGVLQNKIKKRTNKQNNRTKQQKNPKQTNLGLQQFKSDKGEKEWKMMVMLC